VFRTCHVTTSTNEVHPKAK